MSRVCYLNAVCKYEVTDSGSRQWVLLTLPTDSTLCLFHDYFLCSSIFVLCNHEDLLSSIETQLSNDSYYFYFHVLLAHLSFTEILFLLTKLPKVRVSDNSALRSQQQIRPEVNQTDFVKIFITLPPAPTSSSNSCHDICP